MTAHTSGHVTGDGDSVIVTSATSIFGPAYRRLTIGIVALIFLIAFEAMAVATAMPVAVRDLDGLAWYAWSFSGFMVATLFATIVSGVVCDRWGPVPALLAGPALFLTGLIVAGLAGGMAVFVLGRMFQGLGGGLIIVAVYVTVARRYPEPIRPRIFSAMASAWVLPAIVGPFVAGALAEHLSWRLVFAGLAPIVVVPAVLVLHGARTRGQDDEPDAADAFDAPDEGNAPGEGEAPASGGGAPRLRGRTRILGGLAAATGVGLLQFSGQEPRLANLPVAVAGLALVVVALPRLLPAGALRFARGIPAVVSMRGLLMGAFMGAEVFVPLMLVEHRELTPTLAGLALTGAALSWASASWWQGRPRFATPRHRVVALAALLVATGIGLVLLTLAETPAWLAAVGWLVAGAGMGLAVPSLSVLLFRYSSRADQGFNASALQLSDSFGVVTMVGLGGVLFAVLHESMSAVRTFGAIYVLMILLALLASWLANRLRAPE